MYPRVISSGFFAGLAVAALGLGFIAGCSSEAAPEAPPPAAPNPPPVVPPPPPPPPPPANRAPAASAGADVTANPGQSVALDARASTDPDGDTLRYAWVILSGPAGGATLTQSDQATAGFMATIAGTYVVQVSVQDPANMSSTDALTIAVSPLHSATAITLEGLPGQLAQGAVATVAVYLPAPAGAGGVTVALQNSNAAIVAAPVTVTVVEGETVAAFNVDALAPGSATLTATSAGLDAASVTSAVSAAALELASSTEGVMVGQTATLTVTLNAAAPAGGTRVSLALSDATRATLGAAQLDLAAGATSGTATLTGVHSGALTVSASVAGSLPARRRLMIIPVVASATQPSAALIDAALTAGTISSEQATLYGVYAALGVEALPAQYRGNNLGRLDGAAGRLATLRIDTLAPAAQDAIGKYLVPPIYKGSWGQAIAAKARAQAADVSCFERLRGMPTTETLPNWKFIRTRSFKIWYPGALSNDVAQFNWYTAEENSAAALNVAARIQADYDRLLAIYGDHLHDTAEICNGGDAAIDVYVTRVGLGEKAQVMPYLPGACARPGWLWVAPDAALDPKETRNLVAHELVHLFQLRYARAQCDDWRFNILDEATASWAWDHLYPTDNYEHRFFTGGGAYFDGGAGEWRASILEAGREALGNCNGYCDYPFFEWLDRKYGPQAIRGVLDATASSNAQQAIERGLSGIGGGLEQLWPRFALAQWNDWQNHIGDEFNTWEQVPAASIKQGYVQAGSHFIPATLNGANKRELEDPVFDLLRSVRDGELPPTTTNFLDIRFSDPDVTRIHFEHQASVLKGKWPRLKVQALQKINGQWQAAEDWSAKRVVNYCRDKRDERIEELVLIFSNSLAGDEPFLHSGPTVAQLYTQDEVMPKLTISNATCMPWHGTSSVTETNAFGGIVKYTANVVYKEFELEDDEEDPEVELPFKVFVPESGIATVEGNWVDQGGCRQITAHASGTISELESRLTIDFERNLVTGYGLTVVPNTTLTLQCPGADPVVVPGPKPSVWLSLPIAGTALGQDGRTVTGSFVTTDAMTGVTTTSRWSFDAQREE